MKKICSFIAVLLHFTAQSQTVGLLQHSDSSLDAGYVLFAPTPSNNTYLIDKCGKKIKEWTSIYKPGMSCYLLPDGNLLRTGNVNSKIFTAGGTGGAIEKIDWANNVIWSYLVSDSFKCQHHDIKALPNGNVLVVAWESKTDIDAITNGRNSTKTPLSLWSEQILEIKPIGKDSGVVVWEWHLWDHLVQDFDNKWANFGNVSTSPQLIDINYNASNIISDWIHINAIDYNADLDQIILSAHALSEIWIIDHSTTTAQAASHSGGRSGKGGDILYRWGNPEVYKNGTKADQKLFAQHNAQWIEKGLPFANQILIFNNGQGRTGGVDSLYSTIEIINPPLVGYNYTSSLPYLPTAASWNYNKGNPNKYYAPITSGAQQLSNGNVLMCNGPAGTFTEITSIGKKVWEYVNPVTPAAPIPQFSTPSKNAVFRCSFYPKSYSGFAGHSLVATSIIEDKNPKSDSCNINLNISNVVSQSGLKLYPNPTKNVLNISLPTTTIKKGTIKISNYLGQIVFQENINASEIQINLAPLSLTAGMYFVQLQAEENYFVEKLLVE